MVIIQKHNNCRNFFAHFIIILSSSYGKIVTVGDELVINKVLCSDEERVVLFTTILSGNYIYIDRATVASRQS
jgi:hypothetical protein